MKTSLIYVFYSSSLERLSTASFNQLLTQLPTNFQNKIMKFSKWQDAQRSLIGKALLLNGLKCLGLSNYSLNNLKFNEFERPYFNDLIDFNISHSGELTLCAISKTNKVGIDIEKIRDLSMRHFKDHFLEKEWENIRDAKDSLQLFFSYWTQKKLF